ncbi:MAG: hypothetical protein ABI862_21075 [Ilumatobacteraceae bacterium]
MITQPAYSARAERQFGTMSIPGQARAQDLIYGLDVQQIRSLAALVGIAATPLLTSCGGDFYDTGWVTSHTAAEICALFPNDRVECFQTNSYVSEPARLRPSVYVFTSRVRVLVN